MIFKRNLLVLFLLVTVIGTSETLACTTFCLKNKGEVLFGKNYDWMIGDGMIFVNKRGVSKMSEAEKNPARWNSKYGSITFNQYGQYGREAPSGGMNEAGLVIELMWLDDTRYPQPDNRAEVDVLEWIQYNLDTAASVADVIKSSEAIRISSPVKLHYLTSDREGNSATIEFLDGRLVAHTGENLPVATLTNNTYASSLDFARKADPEDTYTAGSLDRFARASKKTSELPRSGKTKGKRSIMPSRSWPTPRRKGIRNGALSTTKSAGGSIFEQGKAPR